MVETSAEAAGGNESILYESRQKASLSERLKRHVATAGMIRRALRHFRESTYFGYPALASAEQGRALYEHLSDLCLEAMREFIARGVDFDGHSPLWKYRRLFMNAAANKVADDLLGLNGA